MRERFAASHPLVQSCSLSERWDSVIPVSQVKKLRLRKMKSPALSHTAREGCVWPPESARVPHTPKAQLAPRAIRSANSP